LGAVNPDDIAHAITPQTILISVMYANNEVGTIEPLSEIAKIAKQRGVIFHTDAVQAGGYLPVNVNELGVDLMSLGAHKFHGPKGVGVLYVRDGTPLLPTQTGGSHERNRRAGTENIPYIVGIATALKIAQSELPATNTRLTVLREKLIDGILERVVGAQLTGDPKNRLPGHASFVIPGVIGDEMVLGLDLAGIAGSTGSACTAGSLEPSHVLAAMGYPADLARGALRLTLGRENTDEDVEHAINTVADVVHKLRREK
jgi:cysteine desulfurase